MSLIQSSPWIDAANYGRGLGDSLGQILLRVPELRAQLAMQQQQAVLGQQAAQRESQMFPLNLQYKQAQIGAENERAKAATSQDVYNAERTKALSQTNDLSDVLPTVQKLMQGQKPTSDELQVASQRLLNNPQGRTIIGHLLEQATKPEPQHVTRPGDVVLQGGQPVYTNNVPPQLTGGNLLSIIGSGQTNASQFKAAQQTLNQRLQMPQAPTAPINNAIQPLRATNPQTGQKIQSLDGGVTWQPL